MKASRRCTWLAVVLCLVLTLPMPAFGASTYGEDEASPIAAGVIVDGRRITVPGGSNERGARFALATPDGSHVYFSSFWDYDTNRAGSRAGWELVAGRVRRVTPGEGSIVGASPDGRFVAFSGSGGGLPDDGDTSVDLYMSDGESIVLVSPGTPGFIQFLAIADDGNAVAMQTWDPLVEGDADDTMDIYLWVRGAPDLILVSPGQEAPEYRASSSNLDHVVFMTTEDVLGLGLGGRQAIYDFHDGSVTMRGSLRFVGMSPDGSVVWSDTEQRLDPTDTNDALETYSHDSAGFHRLGGPNGLAEVAAMVYPDGSKWLIRTAARLTDDDVDDADDIYHATPSSIELLSPGEMDVQLGLPSPDWSVFLFITWESLVPEDQGDGDIYRVALGDREHPVLISSGDRGAVAYVINHAPGSHRITFQTTAAMVPEDTDPTMDIYEWLDGRIRLVTPGNGQMHVFTSVDGSRVIFETSLNVTAEDDNSAWDVYLSDADLVAPVVNLSGPGAGTTSPDASIAFDAPAGDAIWFDCSVDSGPWSPCASPLDLHGLGEGAHEVRVRGYDAASNVGESSLAWTVDWTPPTLGVPTMQFAAGMTSTRTGVPVRVTWTASDAGGVATYRVYRQADGGAWVAVGSTASTFFDSQLLPARRYRFRIEAVDIAGNSVAAESSSSLPTLFEESSAGFRWAGTWARATSTVYHGGAVRYSSRMLSTSTIRVTARSIALISTVGPARGRVQIFIDGQYVTTVELWRRTAATRRVVFVRTWSSSAARTIQFRVVGTKGRPRVDIDAVVTLR